MDATNKEEMYLSALSGGEGELPTPSSRKDQFLYALASGDSSNVPEPTNRWETYMKSAIENGGGSGGGKLYKHSIYITWGDNGSFLKTYIYNDSQDEFTITTLRTWLYNNGYNSPFDQSKASMVYPATGIFASTTTKSGVCGIFNYGTTLEHCYFLSSSGRFSENSLNGGLITDVVTEI